MKSLILFLILLLNLSFVSSYELSSYPDSLDYRDYMGENWMTSVKNQGSCGSCWAFSTIGAIEGFINLYYNGLNVDLSEQELVSSCCENCGNCNGGLSMSALDYIQEEGIVEELCFNYQAENTECNLCENLENVKWKLFHIDEYISNNEIARSKLHSNGPLPMVIDIWNHATTFIGYEKNNIEDIWIFKNSWGEDWGEEGYGYISEPLYGYALKYISFQDYITDIDQTFDTYQDIICSDNDNDGYCYWGIKEEMPSSCPDSCPMYKDEDDSNSEINKEFDLWISGFDIPDKTKIDELKSYIIDLKFKDKNIGSVDDVIFNLYVDDYLLESRYIETINDGEIVTIEFILDPMDFYDPLLDNMLKFEIVPKSQESNILNNYLEREIWIYNYEWDESFVINEEGYVFDCSNSNNPTEEPIESIIGPKAGTYGILVSGADHVQIKNCHLGGWGFGDIKLEYSESSLIQNNMIGQGSPVGIWLFNSNYNNITQNNPIEKTSTGQGIYLEGSSQNEISHNTIRNIPADGIEIALSSNSNVLFDNVIENNYYDGIYVYNSEMNIIKNNLVIENRFNGISLTEFSNMNHLIGNVGNNNEHYFISIYNSHNNYIDENLNQIGGNGIRLIGNSEYNTISSNIICTLEDYFFLGK